MFCNLFKLDSRFNHTLKKELFDYGEMLKPISDKNAIKLLESFGQAKKYAKISNDYITRHLIILQPFTKANIDRINGVFQELFPDNQKDIIDIETGTIYGMVSVHPEDSFLRYHYLIPRPNKKLTNEAIEKYFSENFQIGYLLDKIKCLEGKIIELEEKLVELEHAPHPVYQIAQKHFEESFATNNSEVIKESKPTD